MVKRNYRLGESAIPDGYQIYCERFDVAGVSFRKKEVIPFIKSGSADVKFEREPENQHDPNAIKIMGIKTGFFGKKKLHLGYVPKELAEKIVNSGFETLVLPRLHKTYLGDDTYVEVEVQLLGPKGRIFEFDPPGKTKSNSPTDYVKLVKSLKSEGKLEEAVIILGKCVDLTEKDSTENNYGVAPWYYEQLAMIYRKRKDAKAEIKILERFSQQKHAPGVKPLKLLARLEKLKGISQ